MVGFVLVLVVGVAVVVVVVVAVSLRGSFSSCMLLRVVDEGV
jgi:hypothetical protein